MNKNLINPHIHLIHTELREKDAQTITSRYSKLGAFVTRTLVPFDRFCQSHKGCLYYFNNDSRLVEIASIFARTLSDIESFSPYYIDQKNTNQITFSLWLMESGIKNSIQHTRDLVRSTNKNTQRKYCRRTIVRPLPILKSSNYKHNKDRTSSLLQMASIGAPTIRGFSFSRYSKRNKDKKCRHCGRKGIYADNVCYDCNCK